MNLRTALLGLMAGCLPGLAGALSLQLPSNAVLSSDSSASNTAISLPVDVFRNGAVPMGAFPGMVSRQAWQVPGTSLSTFQLIEPVRGQAEDDGFDVIVDCETLSCGGFDFRFAIPVIQEPQMHVDLGDFRYFLASRTTSAGVEAVSVLVSRSANSGYIQIIRVLPDGTPPEQDGQIVTVAEPVAPSPVKANFDPTDLVGQLEQQGHAVLDDLTFETGSASLGDVRFRSLALLSDYLKGNPSRTVAIVGHTDAVGGLDGNISLSRRRAASVVERLVGVYGVSSAQIAADGVGFLSPRASNLTEEGRNLNRRVEVILTSTQ